MVSQQAISAKLTLVVSLVKIKIEIIEKLNTLKTNTFSDSKTARNTPTHPGFSPSVFLPPVSFNK